MAADPAYITFVAGTKAKASEVNTNFGESAIAFTQIDDTNFSTFGGVVSWVIADSSQAIDIINSSTTASESLKIAYSGKLGANKSGLILNFTGVENTGNAGLDIDFSNAGTTIPALRLNNAGGILLEGGDSTDIGLRITDSGSGNDLTFDAINSRNFVLAVEGVSSLSFVTNGIKIGDSTGPELTQNAALKELIITDSFRLFDELGPKFTRSEDGVAILEDKLGFGGSSQPFISQAASNRLLIQTQLVIGDSSGPILLKNGINRLQIDDSIILTSNGPILTSQDSGKGLGIEGTTGSPRTAVVSATTDAMKTIRGIVTLTSLATATIEGEGFADSLVNNTPLGRITFTDAFAGIPAVVAVHDVATPPFITKIVEISNVSTTQFEFILAVPHTGNRVDGRIHFIVIGPRGAD